MELSARSPGRTGLTRSLAGRALLPMAALAAVTMIAVAGSAALRGASGDAGISAAGERYSLVLPGVLGGGGGGDGGTCDAAAVTVPKVRAAVTCGLWAAPRDLYHVNAPGNPCHDGRHLGMPDLEAGTTRCTPQGVMALQRQWIVTAS